MATRLTDAERAALGQTLPDWKAVQGREAIERSFRFRDFNEAWGFMNRSRCWRRARATTPTGPTSGTVCASSSRRTTPAD